MKQLSRTARAATLMCSLTGALALVAPASQAQPTSAAPAYTEAAQIAEDAYIYGYPLVLMDLTRKQTLANANLKPNQFSHSNRLATSADRTVVRPNVDTLYSTAWLDLSKGAVVLQVPATQRYYVMQMLDAYTNVFAAPGARTTGTGANQFLIAGPNFKGPVPDRMTRIDAPTDMVWLLGRLQVNGPHDVPAATEVQLQFSLRDANQPVPFPQRSSGEALGGGNAKGQTPPELVARMDTQTYFDRLAALLKANPPPQADAPALAHFATIGLKPGQTFSPSAEQRTAVTAALPRARKRLVESATRIAEPVNGWQVVRSEIGTYGTNYDRRAAVAVYGLGANLPEDAVYPGTHVDGQNQTLTGKRRYTVRFNTGKQPPAKAFWSLTLYDKDGYLVQNSINRYALGDRDKLLVNPDGSVDILIQHEPTSAERTSNWLPAPDGEFSLLMRIYSPKPEVLNGQWMPPPVRPAEIPLRPAAAR
ncbi:MAG: DUF1254 domain-containing protein [Myxococcales bacterium]